jgi:hypothetical protein
MSNSSPGSSVESCTSNPDQHPTSCPPQRSQTLERGQVCFKAIDNGNESRAQALEDYILDKKRKHRTILDHQAALWHQRMKEAEERREEQLVEVELVDSGRNKGFLGEREDANMPRATSHGNKTDGGDVPLIQPKAPRLELEASTLLHLLPPLVQSSPCSAYHTGKGKGRDPDIEPTQRSIPLYYPYLTPIASELGMDSGSPAPYTLPFDHADATTSSNRPLSVNLFVEPKKPQSKRVIAFHTGGYGLGWMDFEASADWVVVQKKSRTN